MHTLNKHTQRTERIGFITLLFSLESSNMYRYHRPDRKNTIRSDVTIMLLTYKWQQERKKKWEENFFGNEVGEK